MLKAEFKGEFNDFVPALGRRTSPVEWAGAGTLQWDPRLSFHGSWGSALGRGAGGPMTRFVAGLRYLNEPSKTSRPDIEITETGTSELFTDFELEKLLNEAQYDTQFTNRNDNLSHLTLFTEQGNIEFGVINFEFNSSKLTNEARQTIRRLHLELLKLKPREIKIDGHTDSVGAFKYNVALSKRRADAVKAELIRLGQSPALIKTEGFAYQFPMTSNATSQGRAMNRRIEVFINGYQVRKKEYSRDELELFKEWNYPGGRKPSAND